MTTYYVIEKSEETMNQEDHRANWEDVKGGLLQTQSVAVSVIESLREMFPEVCYRLVRINRTVIIYT